MSGKPTGGRSDVARVVERQMRNWELASAQRAEPLPHRPRCEVAQFVCVSRTVACGGGAVARLLGERLGWPVFDREILQAMAGDDQVRARLYEHLDERDVSWLEDALRWVIRGELRTDDYFCRLTETVLALARRGPAVFLGRGVDLILPCDRGLRVRITASPERRARDYAREHNMSEVLARAEIERIDGERGEFRRRRFGKSANDATRYDLVLNMDRLTPAQAVELLLAALRVRGIAP
jgi:hypothetical protein